MSTVENRLLVLPCKRRKCPVCGPDRWKPYIQAKLLSGLDNVPIEELKIIGLTAPGKDVLPDQAAILEWNEQAGKRWTKFVRLLREMFPTIEVEVWKVWEVQDGSRRADGIGRGALHPHGIVRGPRWIDMEDFRKIAVEAGFGPRIHLEAVRVDKGGKRGAMGYFTKYILKGVDQWESVKHVVTASQGWAIDWKKRRKRTPGLSSWIWLPESLALHLVKAWVPVDERTKGGVTILGPPGEGSSGHVES